MTHSGFEEVWAVSGAEARVGFRFQDLYLLSRMIECIADRHEACIEGSPSPAPTTFGVEARLGSDLRLSVWDVLVLRNDAHSEVIEVKSGSVSRDDRRAFWLRLRRELTVTKEARSKVIPILVVNSERLPTAIGSWRQLDAGAIAEDETPPIPAKPPTRVTSVRDLVAEALHYLCHESYRRPGHREEAEVVDDAPLLDKVVALGVLQQFRLVEVPKSTFVTRTHEILNLLAPSPDPAVLRRQLEGWLSERATATTDAPRRFTIEEMLTEVHLLRRLLDNSPASIRLTQALRQRIALACVQRWTEDTRRPEGLKEVALTETQPQLTIIDWLSLKRSVALIGDGGQGKSYMLFQLYRQLSTDAEGPIDVLAGTAEDLVDYIKDGPNGTVTLIDALQLLADFNALRCRRTLMMVDGLDQVEEPARSELMRVLDQASTHPGFRCIVSCRGPDWGAQQRVRMLTTSWQVIELKDWPDELVGKQLHRTGLHREPSPGLRQLLCNPLYLDLFVRTFGGGNKIPAKLQTRHGLLEAFWQVRVLSDDQTIRWEVLRQGCGDLASSGCWSPARAFRSCEADAVQYFLSVGLLVRANARGRLEFRHPLLRDFAIAQWALAADSPRRVWERIQGITSPVLRYGAHRALIEAICEEVGSPYSSDFRLKDYLSASSEPEPLHDMADILGGLIPTAEMDPAIWASGTLGDVVGRLIRSTRYHLNLNWGPVYASWPKSSEWANHQDWLNLWTLRELVDYLTCAEHTVAQPRGEPLDWIPALAERLREWSGGIILRQEEPGVEEFFRCLMPLVSRWAPDTATFSWLEAAAAHPTMAMRLAILEALPVLGQRLFPDGTALGRRLASLYDQVIGIHDAHAPPDMIQEPLIDEVLRSLTGGSRNARSWPHLGAHCDGDHPLLDTQPDVFVAIAVELLTALTLDNWPWANPPATGLLVDYRRDPPDGSVPEPEYRLLDQLYHRMRRWLAERPEWFMASVYPKVKTCRVGTVQAVLLELALEADPHGCLVNAAREMILDNQLYQVNTAVRSLFRLVAREWPTLTSEQRDRFYGIVRGMIDKNDMEDEVILELIDDPPAELPPDVIELLQNIPGENFGVSQAEPDRPARQQMVPNSRPSGEWAPPVDGAAMEQLYMSCRTLAYRKRTPTQVNAAITAARAVVPALAQSIIQLVSQPWPLESLADLLLAHLEVANHGDVMPLGTLAGDVAELAVSVLEQAPFPRTLSGFDSDPDLDPGGTPDSTYVSWSRSLFLTNALLSSSEMQGRSNLVDRLVAVVERTFEQPAPIAHELVFLQLHPDWWLRPDDPRTHHLKGMAICRITEDLPILATLRMVNRLSSPFLADEFLRVIVTRGDLEDSPDAPYNLGKMIGIRALFLTRAGARLPTRDLMEQLTQDLNRFLLLHHTKVRKEFLWGLAFGISTQAESSGGDTGVALDYARWLWYLWNEIEAIGSLKIPTASLLTPLPLPGPSEFSNWALHGTPPFMNLALEGIWKAKAIGIQQQRIRWRALLPLVERVVEFGPRREALGTVRNLRYYLAEAIAPFGDVFDLVETIIGRMIALPLSDLQSEDWEDGDHRGWQEVARHATEAVYTACRQTDLKPIDVDKGYTLLSRLAAHPIDVPEAQQRLIDLRAEMEQR